MDQFLSKYQSGFWKGFNAQDCLLMGHGEGEGGGGGVGGHSPCTFLQSNDFFRRMKFISFDIFCQSMEAHFTHFLLNFYMLTFGIKVNISHT